MRALVIGLGISGVSAAKFLLNTGAQVVGVDRLPKDIAGIEVLLDTAPIDVSEFDLVVTSPGVPPSHPLIAAAINLGIETIGEAELALRYLPGYKLGITGTNGKTTVTLLTTHILNAMGIKAKAVGNVGDPLTSQVDGSTEVYVVELSSYQLETMTSRVLDRAIILNITPDHLDRYSSMEAYAEAKYRIRDCLKLNGELFLHESLNPSFGGYQKYGFSSDCNLQSDGEKLLYQKIIECYLPKEYRDKLSHDVLNFMASYALCREWIVSSERLNDAVASFKKPAHRIQFVRTLDGVSYYDDSKGTNIDAVLCAVDSLPPGIILIAGGVDKGAAYTPWIERFKGRVEKIYAIGQAANKMAEQLGTDFPVEIHTSLEGAVQSARISAKPGNLVLLSPGCSSFDMFRDYKHRGETFIKIVNELI
jgi:UDP-N-acetylmuramoylalanine--D-glutamate ligase